MERKRLKFEDLKAGDYVFSESLRQHYRIVKICMEKWNPYAIAKKWNYLRNNANHDRKKSKRHDDTCQLDKNRVDSNFFDYINAEFIKKFTF